MKKKGKTALSARLTALCMAALMALPLVPVQTAEAAGATFTKVTRTAGTSWSQTPDMRRECWRAHG